VGCRGCAIGGLDFLSVRSKERTASAMSGDGRKRHKGGKGEIQKTGGVVGSAQRPGQSFVRLVW